MNSFPGTNINSLNKARMTVVFSACLIIVFTALLVAKLGILGMGLIITILITILVSVLAYQFPSLTIFLAILTHQMMSHELVTLLPSYLYNISVGPILVRLFDPVFLGIAIATILRLLFRDQRLNYFLFGNTRSLTLWMAWLILIVIISISRHGVNTLGEFRTYYQYIFLVPYIVISFRTREEQFKLFKLLVFSCLLMIPIAIIRQGALYGFSIAAYNKFLTSSGNLALVAGLIGLIIAFKDRTIRISKLKYQLLLITIFGITLLNSVRSVWLALAIGFLWLYFSGRISIDQQFQLGLVFILVLLIGNLAVSTLGGLEFGAFIEERLKAFTEFDQDSSSSWRFHLWQQALIKIYEKPFFGNGLGLHFKLKGLSGRLITTSPHNLYITIAYQVGVVGLVLYLNFWLKLISKFRKILILEIDPQSKTIISTGLTLLFASSGYYMAYIFDLQTWLFIGLALASTTQLEMGRKNKMLKGNV